MISYLGTRDKTICIFSIHVTPVVLASQSNQDPGGGASEVPT